MSSKKGRVTGCVFVTYLGADIDPANAFTLALSVLEICERLSCPNDRIERLSGPNDRLSVLLNAESVLFFLLEVLDWFTSA